MATAFYLTLRHNFMINYSTRGIGWGRGVVSLDLGVAGYLFLTESKLIQGDDFKKAFDAVLVLDILYTITAEEWPRRFTKL